MRNATVLAALALSACAASAPPAGVPSGPGACRPDGLGAFAGQPATQEAGGEIQRVSGARTLRWVAHGMAVTMDFREDRVTVWLTADNRIERANCG